ncbi:MAG: enoyl-CoA hydratase/isomerase family protein [Acidimicrobiales bacterium]
MPDSDGHNPAPVLITEVTDRIGVITLNRPERRNALNPELMRALDAAVIEMAQRDDVKIVILTGAPGDGAHGGFCSGGDTKDVASSFGGERPPTASDEDRAIFEGRAAMLLHTMPKPTIAMVGGPAVGAGCSLAGACDLRFASEDAVFAANFSANGLTGDYGGSLFWTRIIGTARTRELYFLNDRLTAREAFSWGMVNRTFPATALRDETMAIAQRMLRTPASVLALMKDNLIEAEDDSERRGVVFAHEAANQHDAAMRIAARLNRTGG